MNLRQLLSPLNFVVLVTFSSHEEFFLSKCLSLDAGLKGKKSYKPKQKTNITLREGKVLAVVQVA